MDDEVDELEDRLKSIEYDNWRRNAPFLYGGPGGTSSSTHPQHAQRLIKRLFCCSRP
mgnify:CR=1 FL=1